MSESPDFSRQFSMNIHTDEKAGALFFVLAIELKGDVYPSKNWPFAFSPQGEMTHLCSKKRKNHGEVR